MEANEVLPTIFRPCLLQQSDSPKTPMLLPPRLMRTDQASHMIGAFASVLTAAAIRCAQGGETALHRAVVNGQDEMARLLAEKGGPELLALEDGVRDPDPASPLPSTHPRTSSFPCPSLFLSVPVFISTR